MQEKQKEQEKEERQGKRQKEESRSKKVLQSKIERKAKNHLRIVYWNCGSLSVRPRAAEMLAYEADILCI